MAAKRKPRSLSSGKKKSPTKKKGSKRKAPARKKKTERASIPKPEDYVRDLQSMSGVEKGDFAMFTDPLAWTGPVNEWLPTGVLAVDRLLGGGWPVGRIVEIAAWENVGKSTLIDQSFAMAQKQGAVVGLIDTEQARDTKYTEQLGVDLDKLIVHKAETIEECFEGLERFVAIQEGYIDRLKKSGKEPPIMLIGWDTLAGTPTNAEMKGGAEDVGIADAAKPIKRNLRRLVSRMSKARMVLLLANQFYENPGFGGGIKSYGGSGIRYFTSVRLWLSRTGQLKVGQSIVGQSVEAKVKKTKVSKPRPPAELGLIFGAGIHNAYTLFEWGKTHGSGEEHPHWIRTAAAWQYLMMPDGTYQPFQQQWLGFASVLQERPDIYEQMAAQYMAESV